MSDAEETLDRKLVGRSRVRLRHGDGRTRVRLAGFSPLMVFLSTVVVGVVIVGFVYPFIASQRTLTIGAGCAVLALALSLAYWKHRRVSSGDLDLVIDELQRELVLPSSFDRDRPIAVPMESLLDVAPAEELPKSDDVLDAHTFGPRRYKKRAIRPDDDILRTGHRSEARFVVLVEWTDEQGQLVCSPIVQWSELRRTNAFAHWLCRRVGLPTEIDATPDMEAA